MEMEMSAMEWVFQAEEVKISDVVVGRGAFGEVCVGDWRGVKVACKRLHIFDEDSSRTVPLLEPSVVNEEFKSEMSLLAKLRHPNLVLFLGVVLKGGHPQVILTELMTCSLYDILEQHKAQLSLPEILDISMDVTCGLEYLHCHHPVIIHRDISSKNILIGGNRAKLADLGQAKIYENSVASRQTSMPGAMAYAAPEVLTGKYSEKIDIFSFGVLLIQMCCCEYPRIDRRDDQLTSACLAHPPLESLMRSSVTYLPSDRPSARDALQILKQIIDNDRHYPPARRVVPQSDISILGRRWMHREIDVQIRETSLKLDLAEKLISAEGERWKKEAKRADDLTMALADMQNRSATADQALLEQLQRVNELVTRGEEQETEIQVLRIKLSTLEEENKSLSSSLRDVVDDRQFKAESLDSSMASLAATTLRVEELTEALETSMLRERESAEEVRDQQATIQMQEEQILELEGRLERSLHGWKTEKDNLKQLTDRMKKMTSLNSELLDKNNSLKAEIVVLNSRLGQYGNLPLPDEIRVRFADMESDMKAASITISTLTECKHSLEFENSTLQSKVEDITQLLEESHAETRAKEAELAAANKTIAALTKSHEDALSQLRAADSTVSELKIKQAHLESVEVDLRRKVKDLEAELRKESDRLEILMAKLSAMNGGAALPPSPTRGAGGGAAGGGDETAVEGAEAVISDPTAGDAAPSSSVASLDTAAKQRVRVAGDTEGILGLIQLLRDFPNDESTNWRCARAIRELAVRDESIRATCLESRVDDCMVSVIIRFPKSAMAVGQALRLLGALAYGNDQVRRRAGERGVLKNIVVAMEEHSDDEALLLHACTALTNLLHNSMENRSRFMETAGLSVITGQMDRFRMSAKIQRQACWTILTLAGSDDIARAVAFSGCSSAILNAMTAHRFDSGIQQFGCWAISNLAIAGDDVRRKLKKAGFVELCKIALETHPQDKEVIRQARNAMGVLGPSKP